jgi:hypothetical protein
MDLTLNQLIDISNKYNEMKTKQRQHTINYSRRKREEQDYNFIEKQKQYSKNYYEKNKEKINKKNLERYHNNKITILNAEPV